MAGEIQDIGHEEVDLLAEMQKATEYKPETPAVETIPGSEAAPENSNDFEPAPIIDNPDDTGDKSDSHNINAEDLTDLIIDASDMLIESVMPWAYRKTIDKEDLKLMNEIKRIYKQAKGKGTKVLEFTEDQQRVMDIYIDYDDYVEDLPLTPKERKNLREPLKKVLANVNFKSSPESALMAVAAMIMLPRLLPILTNKFSNQNK
jgi:hypothetical protein